MADPVLTQDELSALLAEDEPSKGGRKVVDHDLTRATRVTGELLRQLSRLHQTLAQRMASGLTRLLRTEISVSPGGVTEQSFSAYRQTLSGNPLAHVLNLKPSGEMGLLVLDGNLYSGCIDRLLGGSGRAPAVFKPLTELDRELMESVLSATLSAWAATWADVLPIEAEVVRPVLDVAELEDLPSAEAVLTMDVHVSGPGDFANGTVAITVPLVALEEALVKLGKPPRFATPRRPQTPEQRQRLEHGVGTTGLPLVITLGTTTLTLAEVLALSPGDVLILDQGPTDALAGRVGGKVRLLAKPGRVGRRLAVVVQQALPPGASTASAPLQPPASPAPNPRPAAGKEASHGR